MSDKLPIPNANTLASLIEMMAELAAQNAATRVLLVDVLSRITHQSHQEIASRAETIVHLAKADYVQSLYAEFGLVPKEVTEALKGE